MERPQVAVAQLAVAPAPPSPSQGAQLAAGAPYLVIVEAELVPTGVCRDYEPMIEVHAVVANRGDGAFPGAPAYGLVGADMTRFGTLIGNGGTVPAIGAGQSVRISFPIFYPVGLPELLPRATRYELKLDRYGYFPDEQMDDRVLVRTLPRPPCSAPRQIARGHDGAPAASSSHRSMR